MQSLGCHPQLISNLLDRFVRLGDQAQSFSLKLRTVTLLPFATSHNGLLRRILRPKGVHNNGSTPKRHSVTPLLRVIRFLRTLRSRFLRTPGYLSSTQTRTCSSSSRACRTSPGAGDARPTAPPD